MTAAMTPAASPAANPAASPPKPVILDCDPGIDDAIAILLGLASPELAFQGITTVAGNVPLSATSTNALKVLNLAGRLDVPVHAGCPKAILGAPPEAKHVHGGDGLGGVELPLTGTLQAAHSVDALRDMVDATPGISLVAVGPLTNVGVLLTMWPGLAERIGRTVIMGGGIERGNVTPHAEFNIHVDPEAARAVFESRLNPVLVPLDCTRMAAASGPWIADLRAVGTPVCVTAAAMLDFYYQAVRHREDGVIIHDATALAVEIWPDLFDIRPARITIDTDHGAERGRTLADFASAEPNGAVAMAVDGPALLDRMMERLAAL